MDENGLARSENMGSVMKATPSMRTRKVECPIQVRLGSRRTAAGSYAIRSAPPARGLRLTHILLRKNGRVTLNPGSSNFEGGFIEAISCPAVVAAGEPADAGADRSNRQRSGCQRSRSRRYALPAQHRRALLRESRLPPQRFLLPGARRSSPSYSNS